MMADYDSELIALGRLEAEVDAEVAEIERQMVALKSRKAERLQQVEEARTAITQRALAEFEETGDFKPHEKITVKFRSRWTYDKAKALEEVQTRGLLHCLRIKTELDVRAFEEALNNRQLTGEAYVWERVPVVEIRKLGDLVIAAEAGLVQS
jgi:hypothetical protein